MSEQELLIKGQSQLSEIIAQLEKNLEALKEQETTERIQRAVDHTLEKLRANYQILPVGSVPIEPAQLAKPFQKALRISHELAFLRLAVQQRAWREVEIPQQGFWKILSLVFPSLRSRKRIKPDAALQLEEIEKLIQSCYRPVKPYLTPGPETDTNQDDKPIQPEAILAVYFQDEYLARPQGPVPYLLIPNYFEGEKPEEWMGIAHETGHHVYRQVPKLREEIEFTVAQALQKHDISEAQRRLWFNWLEETFADLYGVLTLGAAFLYTQQVITLYAGSSEAFWPDSDPPTAASRTRYLQGLLESDDKRHPNPLIRPEVGIEMYQQLLSKLKNPDWTDLTALKATWQQVTSSLTDKSIIDPHTPKVAFLSDTWNPTRERLKYEETTTIMKLVVDALLHSKLSALGCKSLFDLFKDDEHQRQVAVQKLSDPNTPKVLEPRVYVAARRLAIHRGKHLV
jgi:hypothetical protein